MSRADAAQCVPQTQPEAPPAEVGSNGAPSPAVASPSPSRHDIGIDEKGKAYLETVWSLIDGWLPAADSSPEGLLLPPGNNYQRRIVHQEVPKR